MTLKELLEYLTSLSQDDIDLHNKPNYANVDLRLIDIKPVPLVAIDEATFEQVLFWGGIPPCYYN